MSMPATSSQVFTLDELWLLQSVVRHELAQQDTWKFPPASVSLNDAIAEAILFCDDNKQGEAALILSRGDCLTIDYLVPQGAKSAAGQPIGRNILLKSYRARRYIEDPDYGRVVPEAPPMKADDIYRALQSREE